MKQGKNNEKCSEMLSEPKQCTHFQNLKICKKYSEKLGDINLPLVIR